MAVGETGVVGEDKDDIVEGEECTEAGSGPVAIVKLSLDRACARVLLGNAMLTMLEIFEERLELDLVLA